MARFLLASFLLLWNAGAALAGGYRDFNAGIAAADRSDIDAAIRDLTGALAAQDLPAHLRPVAFLARANAYRAKAQFDAALSDYAQAVALKPNWTEAYLDRCSAEAAMKAYDKAVADCTQAVDLAPDNWLLRRARLAIYFHLRNFDYMAAEYSSIIGARPADSQLFIERAAIYQWQGQFDKAIADAAAAAALLPQSPMPDIVAARIYFAEGNFQKSIESFDAAIGKAPQLAAGYLGKAFALYELGRFAEATEASEESLQHFDSQPYAFLLLSMSQAQRHDAVPAYISARFAQAQLSSLQAALVQLYLGKVAPDALLKMKGDDPDSGEDVQCPIGFYLGEWYLGRGDVAEAKRNLQNAVTQCLPNSGEREMAQVELGRVQ